MPGTVLYMTFQPFMKYILPLTSGDTDTNNLPVQDVS